MKKGLVVSGGCLIALAPLIVLAATVYTLMLPNIYCSQTRISVPEDAPVINPFSDQEQYAAYNPYFLRTQFEIIQSQPILYEVINRLNLQQAWGRDGEKLPREVALKILRNSVQVYQMRDTSLLVISVRRDDPDEAAQIANELAETYRDYRLEETTKTAHRKIDLIDEALKDQIKRIEAAEEAVQNIRVELDLAVFEGVDGIDEELIQRWEGERLIAHQEMLEKEAILKDLEELDSRDVMGRSYILSDQIFMSTVQQIQDVEVRLSSLDETHDANHPEVKDLMLQKQKLEEVLKQRLHAMRNSAQTEYAIAKNDFERLDKVLAEIRTATLEAQVGKNRPFRRARADLENERFIYNQLKEKHLQETITLEVPRNPVEMIDIAEPNRRPVSPNLFMNVLLSVLVAGFFALPGVVLLILGLIKGRAVDPTS